MKKRVSYLLSVLALGLFFIACDDDDNKNLTFDENTVEVIIDESVTVKVSGGVSPYTVKEADETIATATIDGSDITIKGVKEGNTTVTVTDKDGNTGRISVSVIEDPYAEEKEDATVRIAWDNLEKVEGTDDGTYSLTKDEEDVVTFTWTQDEENSIVLSFKDAADKIKEPAETESAGVRDAGTTPIGELTVTIEGADAEHTVTSYNVIQVKSAAEGDPVTFWVTFKAGDKEGLFVAPLSE